MRVIALATPANSEIMDSRSGSPMRRAASANSIVNTITGNIAPLAAALITFVGTIDVSHDPKPGTFAEQLASAGSGVATLFEPAMLTRLADVLGNQLPLLSLQPGVQAMANGLPVIE